MRAHPSWQRSANNNKEPHIFSLFSMAILFLLLHMHAYQKNNEHSNNEANNRQQIKL